MSARQTAAKLKAELKKTPGEARRTPNHPTKSHAVVSNGSFIRFGEQGAKTNQTEKQRAAFKSRHAKNIARGPSSPAYWANKVKWSA